MQGTADPNRELLDAAALCQHLVEPGSVAEFLGRHRGQLFPDEMFADLFPSGKGRPSVPADVIASVMVMQSLEGLSDRDATRQLRTNIAWKVATGRALDDPGFHPTVLTLWRNKLRASNRPKRIFEAVQEVVRATGVISKRTRRVLDSTVLDDAVTRQDTIMQLVAQIRKVRRMIPQAAALKLKAHPYDTDAGKPACAWNDHADIGRVVTELITDAKIVLATAAPLKLNDEQEEAVGLLALVAEQDVEPGDTDGTWRIAQKTAKDRVLSVHDAESRHVHKTNHNYRDGFKAHLAAEPETGLITAYALTAGNIGDAQAAPGLLASEDQLLEVQGDSAYGSGAFREHLEQRGHTAVIKPIPLVPAVPGGFTVDDFVLDLEAKTVTCPAGVVVPITGIRRQFAKFRTQCDGCPLRQRCTTSAAGRTVSIHPQHAQMRGAREQARTPAFKESYRQFRPMAERTIAWFVRKGNRRVPYRGTTRNMIWLGHRSAGLNLRRLLNLGLTATPTGGWAIA